MATPCPICGKSDWCRTTADGNTVCCFRSTGSEFVVGWLLLKKATARNEQQYGVWSRIIHAGEGSTPPATGRSEPAPKKAGRAPLSLTYRIFLDSLSLGQADAGQLLSRGLSDKRIRANKYRSLNSQRSAAVEAVLSEDSIAEYVSKIPGFYRNTQESWGFAGPQGIAIPVRNIIGQIVAIKIRAEKPGDGPKYVYASSVHHGGPGAGSPVHIPLHDDDDDLSTVRVTEGELKADVATARTNILTLGLPGVGTFRQALPILRKLDPETVLVAFDADYRTNKTVAAALGGAIRLFSRSFNVVVETWPAEWGKGIDDILAAGKKPSQLAGKKVKTLLQDLAKLCKPDATAAPPTIVITTQEKIVNDQAVNALANDETVFRRGDLLVHVIPDDGQDKLIWRPKGSPRIALLRTPVLRERLAAAARWHAPQGSKLAPAHPPNWTVQAVHARGHWPAIRPLEGVVTGPVLRADGSILATSGYDPATGLLCQLDVIIPDISTNPSRQDIEYAIKVLREAVADFPFELPVHEATWFAMLLTLLARPAFPGPTLLFLVDANVRGSGKGLLFDLAAIIATGRVIPRTPHPTDKEETRKLIMSLALAGDPVVMIDNVAGEFGNSAIEAALTSVTWKDRLLGLSRVVELPLTPLWVATGNNVVLIGDMPRRVVQIRLKSPLENPEERTGFQHPQLLTWATQERGRLLAAALTLLRGYCAAGRPDQHLTSWGSYEGWSDLVRSSIVWANLPDPAETRKQVTQQDYEVQALKGLTTALQAFDPDRAGLTASDMLRLLSDEKTCNTEMAHTMREALAYLCDTRAGLVPSPRSIGMQLAHFRERVVDGRYLDSRQRNNTAAWYVADVETGTKGTKGTFSGRFCAGDEKTGTSGTSRLSTREDDPETAGTKPEAQDKQTPLESAQKGSRGSLSSRPDEHSEDVEVF